MEHRTCSTCATPQLSLALLSRRNDKAAFYVPCALLWTSLELVFLKNWET